MYGGVYARQDDMYVFFTRRVDKYFEVVYSGRVDERNFPHTNDTNQRFISQDTHLFVEFIGNTEEKRPVDFIYFDPFFERELLFRQRFRLIRTLIQLIA